MSGVVTPAAVRAFVLRSLAEPLARRGLAPDDVPDDYDLLEADVIDSLGVLELIEDVNAHFGIDVDYEAIEPEALTVVSAFAEYVAAAGAPR